MERSRATTLVMLWKYTDSGDFRASLPTQDSTIKRSDLQSLDMPPKLARIQKINWFEVMGQIVTDLIVS
jgi:hypothetical protein